MKKTSTGVAKQGRNISQQRLTIGLDLGDRNSWYCVLDEGGQIQLEQRVGTTAISFAACFAGAGASYSHAATPDEVIVVDRGVRAFMQTVSHSVTQDGPLVWIKYFDDSPAFFMAVNGQMAFPNAAAAQEGTRKFAQTIRKIELKWGDDLRVDPLTNEYAVVGVSWREVQVDTAGHSITETGYFTAVAEYRDGHWRFRNAHWSAPVSSH